MNKQYTSYNSHPRLFQRLDSMSQNYAIVPLEQIEYGVYGDLIIIYLKPYSIYLRGTLPLSTPKAKPLVMRTSKRSAMYHHRENKNLRDCKIGLGFRVRV